MNELRADVTREEVIKFYVTYDRRKKSKPLPDAFETWPWHDANQLDLNLKRNGLKEGVVAAYRLWRLVDLTFQDLLECAVEEHIFPGQPQALSCLRRAGALQRWAPTGPTEWFQPLSECQSCPPAWAMILRPSTRTERPAKWYIEDGSGRAICLLRHMGTNAGNQPVACAYVGIVSDPTSQFLRSRPELLHAGIGPAV